MEQTARDRGSVVPAAYTHAGNERSLVCCCPLGTYVSTLSQQDSEVPDYFAGPAMAKVLTQEARVVFGPEQEEWKITTLAERESFAKLGVYETVTLAETGGAEILPGKTCSRGSRKRRRPQSLSVETFSLFVRMKMTSSKTPSYPC